jgi:hypothetical protein
MWDFSSNKIYTFRSFYIPERMMPGLQRYIENHVPPGDFLREVICNNLRGAIGRADDENLVNLPAYVAFLYNQAPDGCWGSKEKYEAWIKNKG